MDIDSNEYRCAEGWYNAASKIELIDFAILRDLDIGLKTNQLTSDWNETVINEKYRELMES